VLNIDEAREGSAVPENDDEAVEDVESVAYVADEAVSDELQQHLDSEEDSEEEVAVLEHLSQRRRLKQRQSHDVIYVHSTNKTDRTKHRNSVRSGTRRVKRR